MAKTSEKIKLETETERDIELLGAVYWQPPNDKYKPHPALATGSRLKRLKKLGWVKKDTRGNWIITRKGVITLNKFKKRHERRKRS